MFGVKVLEPPPPRSVTGAVTQLQTIGALNPSEQLTPLGAHPTRICQKSSKYHVTLNVNINQVSG